MMPLRREMVFLDSLYAEHESGFGDEEYRAIFRSINKLRRFSLYVIYGYVPIAISIYFLTVYYSSVTFGYVPIAVS